jgi:hypothetical protein
MKFLWIMLAGILGNGLGAWNIRTVTSGRHLATAFLTFICCLINMTALREIARAISGVYVFAWAIGSTIGIVGAVWLDRRFFHKDFER